MLSSQRLWPRLWSKAVAFIVANSLTSRLALTYLRSPEQRARTSSRSRLLTSLFVLGASILEHVRDRCGLEPGEAAASRPIWRCRPFLGNRRLLPGHGPLVPEKLAPLFYSAGSIRC